MTELTAEWLGLPYHAPDTGLDDYTAGYRAARSGQGYESAASAEWQQGWFDWEDFAHSNRRNRAYRVR